MYGSAQMALKHYECNGLGLFSIPLGKTSTFASAYPACRTCPACLTERDSSRWLPNRIRSVKQVLLALGRIWARREWAPHFSIDKNKTLSSTGSQTLRAQWFVDTFAIALDKSNTFRADQFSGFTNTMLSEEAPSRMLDIDFARQNKYFQRSTKLL